MNERIRQLYYECCDESLTTEQSYQKFAELVAEYCAQICMSQADRANIRRAFGIHVESNIKYPGPEPHNSIESQYNRELNTTKILLQINEA